MTDLNNQASVEVEGTLVVGSRTNVLKTSVAIINLLRDQFNIHVPEKILAVKAIKVVIDKNIGINLEVFLKESYIVKEEETLREDTWVNEFWDPYSGC